MMGTPSFLHDGSYMCKVAPKLCLTSFILSCSCSRNQATGTLVKYSDSADNYHVEALGAATSLLVIKVLTDQKFRYLDLVAHCDTIGTAKHGHSSITLRIEKQVQANVVVLIKKLIPGLSCKLEYKYVSGHLDDVLWWDQLTMAQQLNVLCESLVKQCIIAVFASKNNRQWFPLKTLSSCVATKRSPGLPSRPFTSGGARL